MRTSFKDRTRAGQLCSVRGLGPNVYSSLFVERFKTERVFTCVLPGEELLCPVHPFLVAFLWLAFRHGCRLLRRLVLRHVFKGVLLAAAPSAPTFAGATIAPAPAAAAAAAAAVAPRAAIAAAYFNPRIIAPVLIHPPQFAAPPQIDPRRHSRGERSRGC
eukprot:61246-Prorocentrum_minimum.AAC.6